MLPSSAKILLFCTFEILLSSNSFCFHLLYIKRCKSFGGFGKRKYLCRQIGEKEVDHSNAVRDGDGGVSTDGGER